MMRRLAVGAGVALATLAVTGCDSYPHSARSVRLCAEYGWSSDDCGISLCLDWSYHYGLPSWQCPHDIRHGTGPR